MTARDSFQSSVFHVRYAWFNLREQFSDWTSALLGNALVPFFIWILTRLWARFNAGDGHFALREVVVYIGVTELLYMTFIRSNSISRASDDFSISLARPRSWLVTSFAGLVGRSLGARLVMLIVLAVSFPLLGAAHDDARRAFLRLLILMPWLAVLQGLFALLFAVSRVLWHQTDYFLLPFNKVFLVVGGVWGPITDFSRPWRDWILPLFPADLFFQPAYYCTKGEFYGLTPLTWFLKTAALAAVLVVLNVAFFRVAKRRHQSYGG